MIVAVVVISFFPIPFSISPLSCFLFLALFLLLGSFWSEYAVVLVMWSIDFMSLRWNVLCAGVHCCLLNLLHELWLHMFVHRTCHDYVHGCAYECWEWINDFPRHACKFSLACISTIQAFLVPVNVLLRLVFLFLIFFLIVQPRDPLSSLDPWWTSSFLTCFASSAGSCLAEQSNRLPHNCHTLATNLVAARARQQLCFDQGRHWLRVVALKSFALVLQACVWHWTWGGTRHATCPAQHILSSFSMYAAPFPPWSTSEIASFRSVAGIVGVAFFSPPPFHYWQKPSGGDVKSVPWKVLVDVMKQLWNTIVTLFGAAICLW